MVITFLQLKDVRYTDGFELRLPLHRIYVFGSKSGNPKTWRKVGYILLINIGCVKPWRMSQAFIFKSSPPSSRKKDKFQLRVGLCRIGPDLVT